MWSRSASAFEPSSVTTRPFTVTRPSRIIDSASRREATPAWAMIFCSRSTCITLAVLSRADDEGSAGLYLLARELIERGRLVGRRLFVGGGLDHLALARLRRGGDGG